MTTKQEIQTEFERRVAEVKAKGEDCADMVNDDGSFTDYGCATLVGSYYANTSRPHDWVRFNLDRENVVSLVVRDGVRWVGDLWQLTGKVVMEVYVNGELTATDSLSLQDLTVEEFYSRLEAFIKTNTPKEAN